MTIKQILITSLLLSLLVVSSAFIPDTAKAQTEVEPADNFQLQAYLTEEQALALVFPECDEILTDEFVMSPEEKSSLEKLLSRRLYEDGFTAYIGKKKGAIQGYAIITEEIGKFHPFTFVVGVDMDGEITNIAVLVYRESRGGEIAKKRFLYQFLEKSLKNPIRINKDIINITGATMSVQYMCAGVRKVLAVINEYYLSGKRSVSDLKVASGHVVTQVKEKAIEETSKSQNTKSKEQTPPFSPPSQGGGRGGKESISDIKLLKQTRMIMGTVAEVSIYSNDEKTAGNAIEEALNEMERMDRIMSNYKNDSELSKVNKKAAKSPVPCNAELLEVIEQSQYYSELSGGAFDITVSPIVALWGFFREKGHVPPDKEIEKLLPAVSYKNIVVKKNAETKKSGTVFFKDIKTQIDLGAIGKGYAVDKALEIIKKCGIDNGCINLGGNIYVLGTPPGKNAWKIGVQHPRNRDEILGYLELKNEATATSGDYERFFEFNGKRYSHIINPRTGRPVSGTIATTIVAPTGTEVDALSTSVFVLGHEKGMELIKKIPNADAMIAYEEKDGKIAIDMTEGFKNKFKKIGNSSPEEKDLTR
ncbi:MAG TPA: FAD:protein FMN transferase [Candidatus Wunengus sp. YC61]|uniref:FAD:protein FMN transferase n=1 Tax=Candidatus Wunengus sp. YC61 TaxID=3367698 RepID=UPI0040294F55